MTEPRDQNQPDTGEADDVVEVSQPDKLLRLGTMLRSLQEELQQQGSDAPSRERLREIQEQATREIDRTLPGALQDELGQFTHEFENASPTESELRVAQAQLIGWLEGLFRGMQAAIASQHQDANQQLARLQEQIMGAQGEAGGQDGESQPSEGTGQYL